jgi:hypothetical protein
MELFLNLLWVLIALVGLAVWRGVWVRQKPAGIRSSWREWTAFVCALVFLFFAVSLTDDLQAGLMVCDECSSGRRASLVCSGEHRANHCTRHASIAGGAVLPNGLAIAPLRFICKVASLGQTPARAVSLHRTSGRAPPVVS